jgi:hypothetical protein
MRHLESCNKVMMKDLGREIPYQDSSAALQNDSNLTKDDSHCFNAIDSPSARVSTKENLLEKERVRNTQYSIRNRVAS